MMARADYWNHNVHYQPVILGAVPPGCGAALDVGCGDGMLACRLADRCAQVTGIDRDPRMIARARTRARAWVAAQAEAQPAEPARLDFIEADFLAYDFRAASFDFVCANTSLHHMDFAAALTKLARILRPGGRLAVIGLAADRSVTDLLAAAPGVPADLYYRAVYRKGESGAPIMDPEMSWRQVRAAAAAALPGVRYRRHLLWRYSLVWQKPG
jgi:ubiquinone/menaquinone biosynthesis C-methylase UbiE